MWVSHHQGFCLTSRALALNIMPLSRRDSRLKSTLSNILKRIHIPTSQTDSMIKPHNSCRSIPPMHRNKMVESYTAPRTKLRILESILGLDSGVTTMASAASKENSCHQAILRFHHPISLDYRDQHRFLVRSYNMISIFQVARMLTLKTSWTLSQTKRLKVSVMMGIKFCIEIQYSFTYQSTLVW